MELPYSQACENNKEPILAVLRRHLKGTRKVFEVGSGTGQHAVHFATGLPHLTWQCSDLEQNLAGLRARRGLARLANLPPPLHFDIAAPAWPAAFDAVFSANTLHIMAWPLAADMIYQAGGRLAPAGLLLIYGPFRYAGQYTSASNLAFDQHLKNLSPECGIRDFEAVLSRAQAADLALLEDVVMPANNQLLIFRKND